MPLTNVPTGYLRCKHEISEEKKEYENVDAVCI
jgi:hypothetical protein